MPRRTTALAVPVAALMLGASLLGSAAPAGADPDGSSGGGGAAAEGLRYVALGDSYSAGAGLEPPDPESSETCDRSLVNYPHVIAEALGARLKDVSCSGATTADYSTSQAEGVPPQLEALGKRTELVTQTIGGNDGGVFADSIRECVIAGFQTGGQGSPCKDEYGSTFVDSVRTNTWPNLVQALTDVHDAAPNATVAILGYPKILPPTEGCYESMPVAPGDVPYLRNLQRVLNNGVRKAAKATGSTYVNFTRVSEGHDACQEPGVRWIEPLVGGTNPVPVHPNELGEQKLAARTLKVLNLG